MMGSSMHQNSDYRFFARKPRILYTYLRVCDKIYLVFCKRNLEDTMRGKNNWACFLMILAGIVIGGFIGCFSRIHS